MKNETEIANWNGVVGERWVAFQEVLERRIRAYGRRVLERAALRDGMRVLDVGAGCGEMTVDAARAVGSGAVVGVDVSRPMLARARERGADLPNVRFVEHDAATFVADAPFDAVISRFGVMFFDDPAEAFANLRRATKPLGQLTFVCWKSLEENAWASMPLATVLSVVGPRPVSPPNAPGPFAFADATRLRAMLELAGWSDVTLTSVDDPMKLGDSLEDALEYASHIGPFAGALREADEPTRARAIDALRAKLAELAPDFRLDAAVWLVTARA